MRKLKNTMRCNLIVFVGMLALCVLIARVGQAADGPLAKTSTNANAGGVGCYGAPGWRREVSSALPSQGAEGVRKLKAWEDLQDCPDCPVMKVLPAGKFSMGTAKKSKDEQPVHPVQLGSFAVSKYEVSWGEFEVFTKASGRATGPNCRTLLGENARWQIAINFNWADPGYLQTATHPVVCVNWDDAKAYVLWLSKKTGKNYRLLSEAEWEYAAYAGNTGQTYWNDDVMKACRFANAADTSVQDFSGWPDRFNCLDGAWMAAPVGQYRPNAFGLYDMLGNVAEWVEDCPSADYSAASATGLPYTCGQCGLRILRGGSWSTIPENLRVSNRAKAPADRRSTAIGFRVARDLE